MWVINDIFQIKGHIGTIPKLKVLVYEYCRIEKILYKINGKNLEFISVKFSPNNWSCVCWGLMKHAVYSVYSILYTLY